MAGIGNHPYLVHYVLPEGRGADECRPAAVVREWTDEPQPCLNLLVFADGLNDGTDDPVLWKTSVYHGPDGERHTWHRAAECEAVTAAQSARFAAESPAEAASESPGGPATATDSPSSASPPSSEPTTMAAAVYGISPAGDAPDVPPEGSASDPSAADDAPDPLASRAVVNPIGQATVGDALRAGAVIA